MLVIFVEALF